MKAIKMIITHSMVSLMAHKSKHNNGKKRNA